MSYTLSTKAFSYPIVTNGHQPVTGFEPVSQGNVTLPGALTIRPPRQGQQTLAVSYLNETEKVTLEHTSVQPE